jgi:hypothetical protein
MSPVKGYRKKIKKNNAVGFQPKLILSITHFKNLGFKLLRTDMPRKNPDAQDPYIHPEADPIPRPRPIDNPETEPSSDPDAPKNNPQKE